MIQKAINFAKEKHKELHEASDELFADFVINTKGGAQSTIMELIEWSYKQTQNPSKKS